ncbi:MAG: sensor histidine kinase, partial [Alphaproteobacteria bacterium]|nr:sensor histidine kinase [Alphaproteobacteria bacterium]
MRVGSIVSRIISLHGVAIVVTSVLMPLALYEMLSGAADDLHHRALAEQADQIAQYVTSRPDGQLQLDFPPSMRELYSDSYGRYEFAVLDAAGHPIVSSLDHNAPVAARVKPQPQPVFFERKRGESTVWGGSFPKSLGERKFWIQVSEDIAHRDVLIDDIVADFFTRVGWITIPILVLLLIIDIFIFWRALRPVTAASSMAEEISPARPNVRLPTEKMPREIVPLVKAVNLALDRLEEGFRVQREFTADAAHELRTPLAILRTQVDMLQDEEIARSLRADIAGMSRIVNQLLDIAELETFVIDPGDRADLRAVCTDVAAFMAPLALRQDKQIAVTGEKGEVWVNGNAETLFQALRNLVENAIAHTPEGTTVVINVEPDGGIDVMDEGPGVPEEARQQIFQRFWRADRRRSGGGLGLAIVARIVEAHHG